MKHTLPTLILTLLVVFACANGSPAQRLLSYEPEVVELDGQLVVQSKYGPPNYGEQPKTDQQVKVPVLILRNRVSVLGDQGEGYNSETVHGVRQVQLAFDGSGSHKTLIGKQVVVTGTLFRAHTGHHYTDVVLKVQSIESKPRGYDQREFVVCGIDTSEWYTKAGYGSSNSELVRFHSPVNDDETLKSFKHAKSGLMINAGVQFVYGLEAKPAGPREIRIALSASNKTEDALHTSDNAVAGTAYGRNWGSLYVEKHVVVGDVEYTLKLYCFPRNAKSYK